MEQTSDPTLRPFSQEEEPGSSTLSSLTLDIKADKRTHEVIVALNLFEQACSMGQYPLILKAPVSDRTLQLINSQLNLYSSALDIGLSFDLLAEAYYYLAALQSHLSRYQSALENIDLAHITPGLSEEFLANSYFIKARCQQQLGKSDEAGRNYQTALQQLHEQGLKSDWQSTCAESMAELYYQAGLVLTLQKKFTAALEYYEQVINTLPKIYPEFKKNTELLKYMAKCLIEKSKIILAGKHYNHFPVTEKLLQQADSAAQQAMELYITRAKLLRNTEKSPLSTELPAFCSHHGEITNELEIFCAECYAVKSRLILVNFKTSSKEDTNYDFFSASSIQLNNLLKNLLKNLSEAFRLNPQHADDLFNKTVGKMLYPELNFFVQIRENYTASQIKYDPTGADKRIINLIDHIIHVGKHQNAARNLELYERYLADTHPIYFFSRRALCDREMQKPEQALANYRRTIQAFTSDYETILQTDLPNIHLETLLKTKKTQLDTARTVQQTKTPALKHNYNSRQRLFEAQLTTMRKELKGLKSTSHAIKVLLEYPLSEPNDVTRFLVLAQSLPEDTRSPRLRGIIQIFLPIFEKMLPLVDITEGEPHHPRPSAPIELPEEDGHQTISASNDSTTGAKKDIKGWGTFFSSNTTTLQKPDPGLALPSLPAGSQPQPAHTSSTIHKPG